MHIISGVCDFRDCNCRSWRTQEWWRRGNTKPTAPSSATCPTSCELGDLDLSVRLFCVIHKWKPRCRIRHPDCSFLAKNVLCHAIDMAKIPWVYNEATILGTLWRGYFMVFASIITPNQRTLVYACWQDTGLAILALCEGTPWLATHRKWFS